MGVADINNKLSGSCLKLIDLCHKFKNDERFWALRASKTVFLDEVGYPKLLYTHKKQLTISNPSYHIHLINDFIGKSLEEFHNICGAEALFTVSTA